MLILDFENKGWDTPFAVNEVHYADNTLTCTAERQLKFWELFIDSWRVFIEINSVLPADTELKLEIEEYNDPRLDALPKTLDFNWKETNVSENLFYNDAIFAKYKDSIYGLIYDGRFITSTGMHLSYDSYMQLKADAEQLNLDAFESKSYTEEFFENNSLILVNLRPEEKWYGGLKDVRYENGVLTYYFLDNSPDEYFYQTVINRDYLYFIEIDTVLPEGVELRYGVIRP